MKRARAVVVTVMGLGLLGAVVGGTRWRSAAATPRASATEPASHDVDAVSLAGDVRGSDVIAIASTDVSPARLDPDLSAMIDELTRMDDELGGRFEVPPEWQASRAAEPAVPPALPTLPAGATAAAQLAHASRWFDTLPQDAPTTRAELDAKRARMSKAGLDLIQSECRAGVCRLSFAYSALSSARLAQRLDGRDSVRVRPNWWSFTIIRPDGRVEGHVFLIGGASRGGTR